MQEAPAVEVIVVPDEHNAVCVSNECIRLLTEQNFFKAPTEIIDLSLDVAVTADSDAVTVSLGPP